MVGFRLNFHFPPKAHPPPTLIHPVLCPGRPACKDHISDGPRPLNPNWVLLMWEGGK